MRCQTCNIWQTHINNPQLLKDEMSCEDYHNFFLKNPDWNWISFTGGEPFLKDNFKEILVDSVSLCKDLHTLSMPTNGYLTEKIVKTVQEVLDETPISSFMVTISLDGRKEVHDRLRGRDGAFDHALATFQKLREIRDPRFDVHFEFTASEFNKGELSELFKTGNFDKNDFVVTIGQNSFFYNNAEIDCVPDKDSISQDLKNFFSSHYSFLNVRNLVGYIFLNCYLNRIQIPCVAGKNSFHMNPYGVITPCIIVQDPIGSAKDGIKCRFTKPAGCTCYTPCESYVALMLHWEKTCISTCRILYKELFK